MILEKVKQWFAKTWWWLALAALAGFIFWFHGRKFVKPTIGAALMKTETDAQRVGKEIEALKATIKQTDKEIEALRELEVFYHNRHIAIILAAKDKTPNEIEAYWDKENNK